MDVMTLNWVDYLIFAVVGISMLISLFRGLVRESISLLTWVCAIWIGFHFSRELSVYLTPIASSQTLRIMLAFVLLFLITLLIGVLITHLLSSWIYGLGLSGTDRILGMVFGAGRGLVVVALLVSVMSLTSLTKSQAWHHSAMLPKFSPVTASIKDFVSGQLTTGRA